MTEYQVTICLASGTIRLGVDGHYQIGMDEVKTEADLLRWVYHLAEKKWVTKLTLRRFIRGVAECKGWGL